jgi:tetratricopeptide (TPR) repeat protein
MDMFYALTRRGAVAVCILLSACAAADPSGAANFPASGGAYGSFLAARYADAQNDPAVASQYYTRALRQDPGNQALIAEGFLAALLAGSPQAETLGPQVPNNALAAMLRGNRAALNGNFSAAAVVFGALPQDELAGLIKPLLLAWTQFGRGDAQGAMAGLAPYFNSGAFGAVYVLNAAMIADAAHDNKDAAQFYAAVSTGTPNLRLAQILASFYARQGRTLQAESMFAALVAAHPDLQIALPALQAQMEQPVISTPAQGLAEAYLTLAGSLDQPSQTFLRTTFLRFALLLRPDLTAARLLLASSQAGGDPNAPSSPAQLRMALDTLQPIPPTDALYAPTALQEANLLAALNQPNDAVALLNKLLVQAPADPGLLANAGDVLRAANQCQEAMPYYSKAIAAAGSPPPAGAWALYFDRGICEDQLGDWGKAQPDVQQALALSPNQPYLLNYLAYTWALRGENLDQAQAMLQQAIGLDPNDGAVLDSLGFVEMKQGRAKPAVALLTQAVQLDPDDAEVNAHLGDAFWQEGQKLQANYQWQRALALHPDAKLKAKIEGDLQKYFAPPA